MRRLRLLALVSLPLAVAAALALWAAQEARNQRREVERALRSQAELLAHTLGPALAAAGAASRELDELAAARLLDNARLLARFAGSAEANALTDNELGPILEAADLDAVLFLDAAGAVVGGAGPGLDGAGAERLAAAVRPLLAGAGDERVVVLEPGAGEGTRPALAAAVKTAGGGLAAVAADRAGAFAFSRQLGIDNLLATLAATGAVLYLVYAEGDLALAATWDGQPAPPAPPAPRAPAADGDGVNRLRGRPVFEVAVPVPAPAGRRATLRVGLDGEPLARAAGSAMRRTALVGAVLAAFGLASVAVTVVQRARAREREEGRRRLADLEEERRRSERLAAAGALAAGLAHEVRNPLNAIAIAAQRIERLGSDDPVGGSAELAARIRAEVARLEGKLAGFLDLARPAAGPRVATDLGEVARDVLAFLDLEAAGKGVRLAARTEPATAVVDREAVRGAVVNLVRNAIEASPPGGTVEVTVSAGGGGAAATGGPRIAVADRGAGLDPDLGGRAFDAFVTTRAGGTGLGLALVRRVAEEQGGRAVLADRPGGGVEAAIELAGGAPSGSREGRR